MTREGGGRGPALGIVVVAALAALAPLAPASAWAVDDAVAPVDEIPALVHERPSPLTFRVGLGARDARRRANEAGTALTAALEEPVEGAAIVEVRLEGDAAVVWVLGRNITTLTEADAAAAGAPLPRYASELETRLVRFVEEERQRSSLQALALRVFLTVLFTLLGILTLRALRDAFARWETVVDAQAPSALQVAGVPILSSDARKGVTVIALMAAKWIAYGGVIAIVVAAGLGQFETTRPWLARGAGAMLAPVLRGLDALVRAIPGIALAALLVVGLRAGLEFVRLLLEGVSQGRVRSRLVPPGRAQPARFFVTAAVVLMGAPLVAAAAFGRFGSPLEHLALAAGACALLASVPAMASATIGLITLWRGSVKAGEWIAVGDVEGEVSSVHLLDLVVVPEQGGSVTVPMLSLVLRPIRRGAPRAEVPVEVARDRPLQQILEALQRVVRSVDDGGSVSLVEARGARLCCKLVVSIGKSNIRDALVRGLVAAVERGDLALPDEGARGPPRAEAPAPDPAPPEPSDRA